jgi:arginase family enzyme
MVGAISRQAKVRALDFAAIAPGLDRFGRTERLAAYALGDVVEVWTRRQ